jgi:hypothetical protein
VGRGVRESEGREGKKDTRRYEQRRNKKKIEKI